MTQYHKQSGAIGLTFKRRKTRCFRCDLPLATSFWKGRIVVYNLNKKFRPDQVCIRCITRESNIDRKFYQSSDQLTKFIEGILV